jgi:ribonuclease HI
MKTLKLEHHLAQMILTGKKTSTRRMFDDKNLAVNDIVTAIDKVDPVDRDSWRVIGELKINKIVELRLGDIEDKDMIGDEAFESENAMLKAYQDYYPNQNVTFDTPVKILYFDFKPYEHTQDIPKENSKQIQNDDKKTTKVVKLYTDGGSRGNPGPSASGYALLNDTNEIIESAGEYLGVTTNNQAEYQALKLGLAAARKYGAREVQVYMDSMLVVNQMKGIFKVKNRDLWPIHDSIKQSLGDFAKVTFTHVPRELNKLADSEANKAMDEHLANKEPDTVENGIL